MITDKFIHLHFPRTAGTSLRHLLLKKYRQHYTVIDSLNHPSWHMIEQYPEMPKFMLIRNPWSWYVSWYFHKKEHGVIKENFDEYLDNMLTADWSEEPNPNRRFIPWQIYATCTKTFMGFTHHGTTDILKYEDLPESYANLVAKYTDIEEQEIAFDLTQTWIRMSKYMKNYRHYYTKEMRDKVFSADKYLIQRFGYKF
jgi:hypothetical protein